MTDRPDPALPQPPKGSASPYALFVKEWFPANKADHTKDGKIDLPTVSSAMSAAWSALTGTDKQSYNDRAKELKKAYDAEYRKWYNALEPEEIKAIEKDTGKKISPPGGKRGKKQEDRDRPGNPGTPITAFFEYLKELREGPEGQGVSVAEVAKKGGESWRQMSEDDKKVSLYNTLFEIKVRRGCVWACYRGASSCYRLQVGGGHLTLDVQRPPASCTRSKG